MVFFFISNFILLLYTVLSALNQIYYSKCESVHFSMKMICSYNTSTHVSKETGYIYFRHLSASDIFSYVRKYRKGHLDSSNVFSESLYINKTVLLLVMNFHYGYYGYLPLLERKYISTFASFYQNDFDLIIVGPKGDSIYKVLSNGLPEKGYYSYHSVYTALSSLSFLRQYYAGLLFFNDDSCIDAVVLNELNIYHFWHEDIFVWNKSLDWNWNYLYNDNNMLFRDALEEAVQELSNHSLVKKQCNILNSLYHGYSDFFYIPSRYFELFLEMESVFYKNRVFLENAVPVTIYCLSKNSHFSVYDCNHNSLLLLDCVHVHPVKFSNRFFQDYCVNKMLNHSHIIRK